MDYTILAYDPVDGDSLWDPYGGDIARHWDGSGEDDYATDIKFWSAQWPSQTAYLWVTGRTLSGPDYDVGTLLLDPLDIDGDNISDEDVYGRTADRSDYAAAMDADDDGAFVTGNSADDGNTPAYDYITFRYTIGANRTIVREWEEVYTGISGGTDAALAIVGPGRAGGHVIVTGSSYQSSTTGNDLVTVNYQDP